MDDVTGPAWYREAWPSIGDAWGERGKTMMALLLGGEAEVSRWLVSQGRAGDSELTPDDLLPLLKATERAPVSVRFWWALSLARSAQTMSVSAVSSTGEVTVRSDRPIAPKLPSLVTVIREKRPDTFAAVMKILSTAKVLMPPHLRAVAIARVLSTGKAHPHSEEAGETLKRRERRKAERAGMKLSAFKRGKPGRPRKSGQ
ncbi:MAG TPA: hypothetical protein PLP50_14950 [Thermoanaerobaculia bacterium]|nr:hypothetical protein [Thermoanaerobaculia bacterium]HQP88619.1 hypothetical protein [Thermoanaerobaculia bacterium]